VFPVPPLPVTTCSRTGEGSGLTSTSVGAGAARRCGAPPRPRERPGAGRKPAALASSAMSEPVRRKWEYATIPLLIHNTKAILDSWGVDGWELVTVLPGPGGSD